MIDIQVLHYCTLQMIGIVNVVLPIGIELAAKCMEENKILQMFLAIQSSKYLITFGKLVTPVSGKFPM